MAVRERIVREIDNLDELQLEEVEEYLAFLKFRSRKQTPVRFNRDAVAQLYSEFAAEDRNLAEEGMVEYVHDLAREDEHDRPPR